MPSPFPGMDPWLENPWRYADIRFNLVVRLSNAINAVLPEGYVSTVSHITDEVGSTDAESFVRLLALGDNDEDDVALTAIELPERHRHWRECRVKGNWRAGRILIRLFRDPWVSPSCPPLAPQIMTQKYGEAEQTSVEVLDYRKPLPSLCVPWLASEPDLVIPLQPLLDSSYDTGRYPMRVKYGRPPDPPLSAEQQVWADGILRAKGLLP